MLSSISAGQRTVTESALSLISEIRPTQFSAAKQRIGAARRSTGASACLHCRHWRHVA